MKLPMRFSKKPIFLVLTAVLLVSALAIYYFFLKPQVKTLDNFPIMVINNGQTAVYQEVKVAKDRLEKEIIVSNLGNNNQKGVKIYEYIPKEVAQKASDIEFSVQPKILEDDPFVLWDVGGPEQGQPVQLNYTVKKRMEETQCLDKKYFNDMQNVYKLDPFDFNDCYKYLHIKFLEAMAKNQKRREQEEQDKVQLIQPGETQYQKIQKAAKAAVAEEEKKTLRTGCNGSKEDMIGKIRQSYSEVNSSPTYGNTAAECEGTCNKSGKRWEIVCSRNAFKTQAFDYESWFTFYVGDSNGQVRKIGNYGKLNGKTYGRPQFGVR